VKLQLDHRYDYLIAIHTSWQRGQMSIGAVVGRLAGENKTDLVLLFSKSHMNYKVK